MPRPFAPMLGTGKFEIAPDPKLGFKPKFATGAKYFSGGRNRAEPQPFAAAMIARN